MKLDNVTTKEARSLFEYDLDLKSAVVKQFGHLWHARGEVDWRAFVERWLAAHPDSPVALALAGQHPKKYRGLTIPRDLPWQPDVMWIGALQAMTHKAGVDAVLKYGPFLEHSGHFRENLVINDSVSRAFYGKPMLPPDNINRLAEVHAELAEKGGWSAWRERAAPLLGIRVTPTRKPAVWPPPAAKPWTPKSKKGPNVKKARKQASRKS